MLFAAAGIPKIIVYVAIWLIIPRSDYSQKVVI